MQVTHISVDSKVVRLVLLFFPSHELEKKEKEKESRGLRSVAQKAPRVKCVVCCSPLQRSSLASMLYLADNIAYMPFQVLDEPLFIIHQIDVLISLHGGGLLQSFKDVRAADC